MKLDDDIREALEGLQSQANSIQTRCQSLLDGDEFSEVDLDGLQTIQTAIDSYWIDLECIDYEWEDC